MDSKQRLVLSILDFLNDSLKDGSVKQDDAEGLEVAIQCIGESFSVDPADQAQRDRLSIKPASLQSIFDVYMKTREKMGAQPASSSTVPSTSKASPSAEDKKRAEQHKQDGNAFMSKKSYKEAIAAYDKAVALDSTNPVYYSNRAAAHSSLEDHYSAIEDAQKAIEVDPKFVKAYSRMGHAYYCVEDYDNAADAYKKGLELDPNNAALKTGLESSKARATAEALTSTSPSPPAGGAGGAGGMPDLASMMSGLMGGGAGGGGGGGGGMPDLASLMSNPAIMQMAQQMMGNGGLDRMMTNPAIRGLAERMQSGGQMPSMADLMSDPTMREAAENLMGGAGGEAAPRGPGSGNV